MKQKEWYVDWFNSPYYHLLYNHRSDTEAQLLIDNLCEVVDLVPFSKVWDMACGKGRHAIALSKKKLDVTGSDLSENSIAAAKQFEHKHLHFLVHDMLEPFHAQRFDLVCNLFTSFGYFKTENDNQKVFANVAYSLVDKGYFLIDYFNAKLVCEQIPAPYVETRGDLKFEISKQVRDKRIIKHIEFTDKGRDYYFEETVDLLDFKDFETYANAANFTIEKIFGDYHLHAFDAESSPRLIMLFRKK